MNLRLSIGTAAAMGLATLKTDALPTTAYLMDTGGRCAHNCAFCAQARSAKSEDSYLSRVIWKEYPLEQVIEGLKQGVAQGQIRRACVQVTLNKGSYERTLQIVKAVTEAVDVPLSVSTNISSEEQVHELFAAGAARISIALDAATEDLHDRMKNANWDFKVDLLVRMAAQYPNRITTHFIVGLGETEEQLLKAIQSMYDQKVTVGLFAFTPVKGTAMEHDAPPLAGQYRRVQLANWLMKSTLARVEQFLFDDGGQLKNLNVNLQRIPSAAVQSIGKGEPFRTAGCAHCNRPFYNESPGHGVLYNYPRPLKPKEARKALEETELFTMPQLEQILAVTQ